MNSHPPVLNRKLGATRTGLLCTALLAATAFTAHAQNTGFGTVTPASKVTVKGNFAVGSGAYTSTPAPVNGAIIEGYVGIGTVNPLAPLHVKTNSGVSTRPAGYVHIYKTFATDTAWGNLDYSAVDVTGAGVSIWADGAISTSSVMQSPRFDSIIGLTIVSDRRTKDVIGVSDASKDLDTLKRIPVTDYTLKDKRYGKQIHKMVIAQEVETVFPNAVNKTTRAIPDIMQLAETSAAGQGLFKVTLAKKADLKVGDRVEIHSEEGIPEIVSVQAVEDNVLTVPLKGGRQGEQVFVYGREVNDFRTVDYDAISMLNVSATQELSRKLDAQQTKIAALETENAELRKLAAKVEKMEALVAALEGKANGTVTVSLTK